MSKEEKYAERIRALLAKAESTEFEAERESFMAAAQSLMTKYAISEALIDQARGRTDDVIEQREIYLAGQYRHVADEILFAVARVNNCRAVYIDVNATSYNQATGKSEYVPQFVYIDKATGERVTSTAHKDEETGEWVSDPRFTGQAIKDEETGKYEYVYDHVDPVPNPEYEESKKRKFTINGKAYTNARKVTLTGFRSDLDRVVMLDTSLQLQCITALQAWWKEYRLDALELSNSAKIKNRKQFIVGFAKSVEQKLQLAFQHGARAAARDEAARTGSSEGDATKSVALVLRSRKDRVEDWYDEKYGDTVRSVSRDYWIGDDDANDAGWLAGQRADIGQPGVNADERVGLPA